MAQQAVTAAAQASEQVQADIADIQARWALIQAQAAQGQAAAPPLRGAGWRVSPVIRESSETPRLASWPALSLAPCGSSPPRHSGAREPAAPFTAPWLQWWNALAWWGANWWVNLWLVLAAVVPTVFLAMLLFGLFLTLRWRWRGGRRLARLPGGGVRAVERGVTDNHGHAQWRSMADALKLFPGPDARHGGVVVGEAYRVDRDTVAATRFRPRDRSTWGRGGTAPLLIDPCTEGSGHSIVFAGPGGYKTTSAVSTILEWTGSSVILDPSTELGPMLDAALRAQGKTVAHIGVFSGDDTRPPATGINVLAWIDIAHPEAEIHVRTVVSWIYDSATTPAAARTEDPFFAPMGRELVTCLLAHLLWTDDGMVDKTLASLAMGISVPETDMLDLLAGYQRRVEQPDGAADRRHADEVQGGGDLQRRVHERGERHRVAVHRRLCGSRVLRRVRSARRCWPAGRRPS